MICGLYSKVRRPIFIMAVHTINREVANQWYSWVVIAVEVAITFFKSYAALNEEPTSDDLFHILLMGSPLSALVVGGIAFHTTLWGQFVGQLISTIASHFWIYPLCNNSHLVSRLTSVSDGLLWHLESCISTVYLVRFKGGNRRYPCAVSLGFFHFTVGFLIPCIIKYVLESHHRAQYLATGLRPGNHKLIWCMFWSNVRVAIFVGIFFFMGSWALVYWLVPFG